MTDGFAVPVVLDATVLSNFASSGSVDWLVELLDRPATTPAVRSELERGRDCGYDFLADAVESVDDEISVLDALTGRSAIDPAEVRKRLDPGEAESLVRAIEHGGTLATDDLAARTLAGEHDVPVTGSIGLLVAGVERDALDVSSANEWLRTWRTERSYHAPVDSIEAALDAE
jgi:predicted nucleic acid-binding protein